MVHTGQIGLAEAEDAEIIRRAADEDRVVVTLDADFHTLLALAQATRPSVIRIRIEGLRAEEFLGVLQTVLRKCADELAAGAVVSVTETQIRVRRLPVS